MMQNIPEWWAYQAILPTQITVINYNVQFPVSLAIHTFVLYQSNTQYTVVPESNSQAN
jgi:hypothetical protein